MFLLIFLHIYYFLLIVLHMANRKTLKIICNLNFALIFLCCYYLIWIEFLCVILRIVFIDWYNILLLNFLLIQHYSLLLLKNFFIIINRLFTWVNIYIIFEFVIHLGLHLHLWLVLILNSVEIFLLLLICNLLLLSSIVGIKYFINLIVLVIWNLALSYHFYVFLLILYLFLNDLVFYIFFFY